MGSCGEANPQGIDASVGGLVWVRRRNGCWWPGRIMGLDELPESRLVSSKVGTPVKLLGRQNASVDWYNLERSKRVKAFRCGDYDKCIEKAKASAASTSKKMVKYARREDAILHALELESALKSNGHSNFCLKLDETDSQEHAKGLPTMFPPSEETEVMDDVSHSFEDIADSAQEISQSGVSFEEPNHVGASMEQSVLGRRQRTPNDSEDDGTEGVKRMRGLEDLGMGVVSTLNRKRSQVANCHRLKRRNRRLPLAKVLESTAMFSVPVTCNQGASPSGSSLPGVSDCIGSGFGSNESKGKTSIAINNNSDCTGVTCENGTLSKVSDHDFDASLINQKENEISSSLGLPETESSDRLFDVPFVGNEKHVGGSPVVSCSSQKAHVGTGAQSSQSSQVETVSLGNEECNESGSTNSGAADLINISQQGVDRGTSKWQSKRKRNSRHKTKITEHHLRKSGPLDDESLAYLRGIESGDVISCEPHYLDTGNYRAKSKPVIETQVDEFRSWTGHYSSTGSHMMRGSTSELKFLPYRQPRFTLDPKYQLPGFATADYNTGSILYDVNLEVRASYCRPHNVPYVSLTSKLNGESITGHSLTVEALDDGFCDELVYGHESYMTSTSCELDADTEENMTALDNAELGYKPKKPNQGRRIRSKHMALQPPPPRVVSPNKFPLKTKKNGFSSKKKIRKLSSLAGGGLHKQNEERKNSVVVEKLANPAVACVPLKVVFSRLNESLTGGSTRSAAVCVVMSRDP